MLEVTRDQRRNMEPMHSIVSRRTRLIIDTVFRKAAQIDGRLRLAFITVLAASITWAAYWDRQSVGSAV
jgi:hypothetical protein